jgi:hypothetical protein
VALQMDRRTRGRSGNHRDQTRSDGLTNGDAEVQRENGSEQNAAADSGQRAEQAGEKSKNQKKNGYHGRRVLQMPISAMAIRTRRAVISAG